MADGFIQFELGFLGNVAELHFGGKFGFALEIGVEAGHDAQQGAFAGAVFADDADLGAVEEREGDVAENDLVAITFTDITHFKDKLGRHLC
ncbi:MAG: hypothetical protein BWY71_00148 [Planctomycetes bacterium ADurb.Bin412]|nr:MAG: hypothetical protein BWY71_00148 [Planctomycetes bacterium ADurb.Bin412]